MSRKKKSPKKNRRQPKAPSRPKAKANELSYQDLMAIVDRAQEGKLSAEDISRLKAAFETLAFLTQELERKGTSIVRLRKLLFGSGTEKTSKIFKADSEAKPETPSDKGADAEAGKGEEKEASSATDKEQDKPKRKGHGRNGADDFVGAERIECPHGSLKRGDKCPKCEEGKVYPVKKPSELIRITGMGPLTAKIYQLDKLRCNACGELFTARPPVGVRPEKYDFSVAAMIAILKYGCGLPFTRLERLQKSLGIPLPASTQWELVEQAADLLSEVYLELIRQAASGRIMHNDDTTMRMLDPPPLLITESESGAKGKKKRSGIFTSGIVSVDGDRKIALFFTGRKHAGENLAAVLAERAKKLGPPLQMCDALSRNTATGGKSGSLDTILGNCLAHGRRQFVDVAHNFPEECEVVLTSLGDVYYHDRQTRELGMSDQQRLEYHQAKSGPIMAGLLTEMQRQLDERMVEETSGLGKAYLYMTKHWTELTLFLREPGAPLDNNICERAIKKAILHRRNSLFYKTENGARVGDMFMSFIYTAELQGVNPFEYLAALLEHAEVGNSAPAAWMPWNYTEALARLTSETPSLD